MPIYFSMHPRASSSLNSGRSGRLNEARELLLETGEASSSALASLLGACKFHSDVKHGEEIARLLTDLDPESSTLFVILSNIWGGKVEGFNHDDLAHLKIPLENILSATNNFDEENLTETADFGNAYTGQLLWSGELIKIIARRFNKDEWDDEKEQQFCMQISLLSTLKHKNVVSLVGFCDENDENIIVTKFETWLSLDNYLSDAMMLTWLQRLEICVGLANALSYIHYDEAREFSVIHRNIDSLNVLLNDNWEPKLSEFRLSMKIEASQRHHSFRVDKVRDIEGYTDPTYIETKLANHKVRYFSFGG
ncbi:kinase-like domain, phloem protein 2-like protein [Tanacetum coccineum]